MRLATTGGGRDRLGALIAATAAFLRQLLDPDGAWDAHLMLWELQPTEGTDDALDAWLSSHALPGTMQIVFQGLGALQQVARASVVLGDALYEMRRSLLHLLGAAAITHVVRLGLAKRRGPYWSPELTWSAWRPATWDCSPRWRGPRPATARRCSPSLASCMRRRSCGEP